MPTSNTTKQNELMFVHKSSKYISHLSRDKNKIYIQLYSINTTNNCHQC